MSSEGKKFPIKIFVLLAMLTLSLSLDHGRRPSLPRPRPPLVGRRQRGHAGIPTRHSYHYDNKPSYHYSYYDHFYEYEEHNHPHDDYDYHVTSHEPARMTLYSYVKMSLLGARWGWLVGMGKIGLHFQTTT